MGHVDDKPMTRWQRFKDNDIVWSFLSSPGAMIAAAVASVMISACIFAPVIAPFDPFDPAQISLWDGKLPPAWVDGGQSKYLLGTDNQGRDMISTILYGGRLYPCGACGGLPWHGSWRLSWGDCRLFGWGHGCSNHASC